MIEFSESMASASIRLKDKDGTITEHAASELSEALARAHGFSLKPGRAWGVSLEKTDLLDATGRPKYDKNDSPFRTIAIIGKDMANRDVDTDPATVGKRTDHAAWTGYEHAGVAAWRIASDTADPVVDTHHAIKIDMKHDQSPDPKLSKP